MTDVRVHAVLLARNEADVIRLCLQHAARFCESITVADHAGDDGTWDAALEVAGELPAVVPLRRFEGPYTWRLVASVFHEARARYRPGDWILKLDADEFLEVDPRPMLAGLQPDVDAVLALQAQFYVTPPDLDRPWFTGECTVASGFDTLPDHYRIDWAEARLFRYDDSLAWPHLESPEAHGARSFPSGVSCHAEAVVVNRHYQFRSREQMQRRLALRRELARTTAHFGHSTGEWRDYVVSARRLKRAPPGIPLEATPRERGRAKRRRAMSRWKRRIRKKLGRGGGPR